MDRVGVYVRFRALPGRRAELVEVLLAASRLMSGAPGCELYVVNTAVGEDDVVWVTEVWRSVADLDRSLFVAGVKELIDRSMPLVVGPPERTKLTPVGGVGLPQ